MDRYLNFTCFAGKMKMRNPTSLLFRYRVFWHVLFWVLIYLFYALTYGGYAEKYKEELISNLILLPARIAFTYAFIYYLMPVFLFNKRYFTFSSLAVIHAMLFGFALWALLHLFVYCKGCMYDVEYPLFHWPKIFGLIIGNYEIPAVAGVIVMFKKWYTDQQKTRALEKDKLEAELKFLKSQIHPHFLFNTLNNLYALTLKKSDKAPDMVIRISEMLDYMLYQSNEKEVELSKEINLIQNFLELERIRYGDRLDLKFQIQGDPEDKFIAPLLLLPFLENSFKHGVSNNTGNPFIHMQIEITEDDFSMHISNSFGNQTKESYSEGIGLKNVERRLELLYKEQYILRISKNDGIFEVYFRLNWSNQNDEN